MSEGYGAMPTGAGAGPGGLPQTGAPPPPALPPPPAPPRLLRRSRGDKVIGGVCGGLGRYFGIDPILLRIVAVALALSGGFGVLAYVVAWIVIPEEDEDEAAVAAPVPAAGNRTAGAVVGAALVVVGALLLVGQALPWLSGDLVWPVVIVAIGVAIVVSARRTS